MWIPFSRRGHPCNKYMNIVVWEENLEQHGLHQSLWFSIWDVHYLSNFDTMYSAIAKLDVRPGDSIPNKFISPGIPWMFSPCNACINQKSWVILVIQKRKMNSWFSNANVWKYSYFSSFHENTFPFFGA